MGNNRTRSAWRGLYVLGLAALVPASATCGARSELWVPPPLPPQPECDVNEDCPGSDNLCAPTGCVDTAEYEGELPDLPAGVPLPPRVCVVLDAVDCDDDDVCTLDACLPETGECDYEPATYDLDEDGYRAPRPGTKAGDPDSCGDDCDDTSAAAFPGNPEICDGVDNDCNGIVDDGASFIPLDDSPVKLSSDGLDPAGPGGIAYGDDSYMSIYWGNGPEGSTVFETRLLPTGEPVDPIEKQVLLQNADGSGGPIVWIGDRYGVAWQERGDDNYEIYFTILKPNGDKAYADTRLTFANGFSINVDLGWNGSEFIVVWQDDRNGDFEVMGQRVDIEGQPVGGNIALSNPGGFADENPAIASGEKTLGLAFFNGDAGQGHIRFRTFEQTTLEPYTDTISLTAGDSKPVDPAVVWNEDRYLVAWFDTDTPVKAIFAATVSEEGEILTPATAISSPGNNHSRYPSLLPLGDRALVVYADNRDDGDDYELYTRMIDQQLQPFSPEMRITTAAGNSLYPITTFGPDGNVGVLFRDDRTGDQHTWFTRLGCVTPSN